MQMAGWRSLFGDCMCCRDGLPLRRLLAVLLPAPLPVTVGTHCGCLSSTECLLALSYSLQGGSLST
jgi:hypothetical protein